MKRLGSWISNNRFWLVGIGLMLASSGLDGAYLAAVMGPLGFVLNTTVDIASEVIMNEFAMIRRSSARASRRYRLAGWLLACEAVLVGYSWFLTWRRLLIVLPPIEGAATWWVALVLAGFVPIGLIATGYAQALVVSRESAGEQPVAEKVAQSVPLAQPEQPSVEHWRAIFRQWPRDGRRVGAGDVVSALTGEGWAPVAGSTARRWSHEATEWLASGNGGNGNGAH